MKNLLMLSILMMVSACAMYSSPEEEYLAKNRKTCMNKDSHCKQQTDRLSYFNKDGKEVVRNMQTLTVPDKDYKEESIVSDPEVTNKTPEIVDEFATEPTNKENSPAPTLESEFDKEL